MKNWYQQHKEKESQKEIITAGIMDSISGLFKSKPKDTKSEEDQYLPEWRQSAMTL